MKITAKPVKCQYCGCGNVPARKVLIESNGVKQERLKWICPRCGRVTRQDTISSLERE